MQAGFATQGFADAPDVLSTAACAAILRELPLGASEAVGSRLLLRHSWCRRLADALLQNSLIASIVPRDYVAAQCTYFEKSLNRNWLVPMHQDLAFPSLRGLTILRCRDGRRRKASFSCSHRNLCWRNWLRFDCTLIRVVWTMAR